MFEVNIVQVDSRWLDPWLNVQTLRWLWDVFWTHDCFLLRLSRTTSAIFMIRLISLMLVKTCVWLDKIWLANAKSKDVLYVLGWKFQPCPFWQPCFSNVEGCLGGWKAAFGRGFKLVMKGRFFGAWIDRYWMNLGGTLVMWYGGRVSIEDDPGSFMSWFVDTISVAWHLSNSIGRLGLGGDYPPSSSHQHQQHCSHHQVICGSITLSQASAKETVLGPEA